MKGCSGDMQRGDCMPNNNGWISVKDRLPMESGNYLVCGYDMKDDRKLVVTTRKWIHSMYSFYGEISVIAWMPLPEPYNPQEGK